jgi:hypothetical protein
MIYLKEEKMDELLEDLSKDMNDADFKKKYGREKGGALNLLHLNYFGEDSQLGLTQEQIEQIKEINIAGIAGKALASGKAAMGAAKVAVKQSMSNAKSAVNNFRKTPMKTHAANHSKAIAVTGAAAGTLAMARSVKKEEKETQTEDLRRITPVLSAKGLRNVTRGVMGATAIGVGTAAGLAAYAVDKFTEKGSDNKTSEPKKKIKRVPYAEEATIALQEGEMKDIHSLVSQHLPHGHLIQGLVLSHSSPNYVVVKSAHKDVLHQTKYHHLIRTKDGWKHMFTSHSIAEQVVGIDERLAGYALSSAGRQRIGNLALGLFTGVGVEASARKYLDHKQAQSAANARWHPKKRKQAVKENYGLEDSQIDLLSEEMIDELSVGLLSRYAQKAQSAAGKYFFKGDIAGEHRLERHAVGLATARKKIADKVVQQQTESIVYDAKRKAKSVVRDIRVKAEYAHKHPFKAAGYVLSKPWRDAFELEKSVGKAAIVGATGVGAYMGTKALMAAGDAKPAEGEEINESFQTDVYKRIDTYKEAGFKVSDVKIGESKASFVCVDPEGHRRKHYFEGSKRRVEDMGKVEVAKDDYDDDDEDSEVKPTKKKKYKIKVKK